MASVLIKFIAIYFPTALAWIALVTIQNLNLTGNLTLLYQQQFTKFFWNFFSSFCKLIKKLKTICKFCGNPVGQSPSLYTWATASQSHLRALNRDTSKPYWPLKVSVYMPIIITYKLNFVLIWCFQVTKCEIYINMNI